MQDLPSDNIDLAEIMDAHPRKRVVFDVSRLNIGQLTLLELMDAADASGLPFDELRMNLEDPKKQTHMFYALAWVIMRRGDPALTYVKACEFDLVVEGEVDVEAAKQSALRAEKVVAIAALANVSPQVAGQMTMDEVQATVDLQERRNRAMRRKTRRRSA
jgi:hypothetical protein